MKTFRYTTSKINVYNEKLIGSVHYSETGDVTICGKDIDTKWWILSNNFDGKATCKKCLTLANA